MTVLLLTMLQASLLPRRRLQADAACTRQRIAAAKQQRPTHPS